MESSPNIFINGLPAAMVGTLAICDGPPDAIAHGSATVFFNGRPVARMGDMTVHGGLIISGSPNVIIGDAGSGAPGSAGFGAVVSGAASAGVSQKPNPSVLSVPAECAFLNKQFRVQGTKQQFNAARKSQSLSSAIKKQFTFPGATKPEAATQQTVTIDGHSVDVIQADRTPTEPGTVVPSTSQIASSLGAIPNEQLSHVHSVVVSPDRSPNDAYWAKQYSSPGFRSEADAGADGNVHYYPIPSNSAMIPDETLIHESGHSFSKTIWPKDSDWNGWRDAMKADGKSVSQYADSSKDEDFSESLVMYTLSKGTSCEATARAMFPHRYAMLDALLRPKLPDRAPMPNPPSKGFFDWLSSLFD